MILHKKHYPMNPTTFPRIELELWKTKMMESEKFFCIVKNMHGKKTRNNANRFARKFNVRLNSLMNF